jgi:hypothetical protein
VARSHRAVVGKQRLGDLGFKAQPGCHVESGVRAWSAVDIL